MLPLTPEKIVDVTLTLACQGKASCRRELRAQLTGFQHRLKERGIVCHLRGSFVIPAQPLRGFTDAPREQRAFHRKAQSDPVCILPDFSYQSLPRSYL